MDIIAYVARKMLRTVDIEPFLMMQPDIQPAFGFQPVTVARNNLPAVKRHFSVQSIAATVPPMHIDCS